MKVTKVRQFSGHKQSIYCICDGGGGSFYSAGSDGLVVKWNIHDEVGHVIATVPDPLFCIGINKPLNLLAIGSRQGRIYIINTDKRALNAQWQGHQKAIFELYFEPKGTLLSLSEDGTIKRWQVDGEMVLEREVSTKSLRGLSIGDEGYYISSSDGLIYHADKETLATSALPFNHNLSVFSSAIYERNIISAGREAKIRVWHLDHHSLLKEVNAHWYSIHYLSLSPNGCYLLSGSMDKNIRIWNPQTLSLYKTIDFMKDQGHTSSVNRLVWIDDEHFLSCSDDRQIMLWRIKTDENCPLGYNA